MSVLPSRLPLLKKYTDLLSKTCVLCQEIIRCTTSAIPVLFAAKILSISRFFLPTIDATINGVLVTRFPPSSLITFDLRRDIYLPPDATSKLLKVAEKPMPRTHSLLDMSAHRNLSADFASIDDDDALSDDADSKSRETVIDFSRDTILPSSETPSPSPIPLFALNSFSPIPKSSPSLDGMSEMDELDEVNVPEVSEKEVCSHSLRVKDYRRTIDRVCLRSRQDPANRARHDAMVAAFPTLFFWREVVGEVAVPGLEGEAWWRERYFSLPLFTVASACATDSSSISSAPGSSSSRCTRLATTRTTPPNPSSHSICSRCTICRSTRYCRPFTTASSSSCPAAWLADRDSQHPPSTSNPA